MWYNNEYESNTNEKLSFIVCASFSSVYGSQISPEKIYTRNSLLTVTLGISSALILKKKKNFFLHLLHLKHPNLFHSSQQQNVNLPASLQLAPAVERGRSATTTNLFPLALTCSNLHLDVSNNLGGRNMLPFNLLFNSSGSELNHVWTHPFNVRQRERRDPYNVSSLQLLCVPQQPEESEPVKRSTRSAAKSASGKIKVSWLSVLVWFLFTPLQWGICRHVFLQGSRGAESCTVENTTHSGSVGGKRTVYSKCPRYTSTGLTIMRNSFPASWEVSWDPAPLWQKFFFILVCYEPFADFKAWSWWSFIYWLTKCFSLNSTWDRQKYKCEVLKNTTSNSWNTHPVVSIN